MDNTTRPTRSQLMKAYDAARYSGKFSTEADRKRLNRAFGIAQSKGKWSWEGRDLIVTGSHGESYHANGHCECVDYKRGHELCKHRVARFLLMKAAQFAAEVK